MSRTLLCGLLVLLGLTGCNRGAESSASTATPVAQNDQVPRGKAAIERYGCGTCHVIPGVAGAQGRLGPSLAGIADRTTLAREIRNNPANLQLWITDPQSVAPGTMMPDLGVTDAEGQDMVAFLYTLKQH